jgi:hypothetical protein
MATKTKREDREVELRRVDAGLRFKVRLVDGVLSLFRTALRGAIVLGALYIAAIGAAPFAGRNTAVTALVSAMVDLSADRYFFLTVAVIATGSWWQERRKRTKLIKEWGAYVRDLETKIDSGRSSSGLLKTGKVSKEDDNV